MRVVALVCVVAGLAFASGAGLGMAQQSARSEPYWVGNRLGLPLKPAADGAFNPMSSNAKAYGGIFSAESCSYDAARNLLVVPSRGVRQNVEGNNAWVSLINHDGSVHTARWIGIQTPGAERTSMTPPLALNDPTGSDIANGMFYVSDRDGGTSATDPSVAVIRWFNLQTGAPVGQVRVPQSTGFNDIEVADDGTIYASETGQGGASPDPATWQIWKITRDGAASIFIQGAPLREPNGIAFDPQGNIVVVNSNNAVLTFSTTGALLRTETTVQPGNDGVVVMPDGTKYVGSVQNGGISRIRPGRQAELVAQNIPTAASLCYDAGANQLVVPMPRDNALAFIPLN